MIWRSLQETGEHGKTKQERQFSQLSGRRVVPKQAGIIHLASRDPDAALLDEVWHAKEDEEAA